jgi:hypothetical protein
MSTLLHCIYGPADHWIYHFHAGMQALILQIHKSGQDLPREILTSVFSGYGKELTGWHPAVSRVGYLGIASGKSLEEKGMQHSPNRLPASMQGPAMILLLMSRWWAGILRPDHPTR